MMTEVYFKWDFSLDLQSLENLWYSMVYICLKSHDNLTFLKDETFFEKLLTRLIDNCTRILPVIN